MNNYPEAFAPADQVQPVPRRIRGEIDGLVIFDTTRALYLWEWPFYPQYLIPREDIDPAVVTEGDTHRLSRGTVVNLDLQVGATVRQSAARQYTESPVATIAGFVRFDWDAVDVWYEEDERVFVHPRNPYVRVDAIRSSRRVRVERDGLLLAESDATVMLFETGLPTRYYFDRTAVDFSHLVPVDTVSACPYKGRTTEYWDLGAGESRVADLAWSYSFPLPAVAAITGLVAFYDELVDTSIDGVGHPRPRTHHRRNG